jgi:hypothetical protein
MEPQIRLLQYLPTPSRYASMEVAEEKVGLAGAAARAETEEMLDRFHIKMTQAG